MQNISNITRFDFPLPPSKVILPSSVVEIPYNMMSFGINAFAECELARVGGMQQAAFIGLAPPDREIGRKKKGEGREQAELLQ